MGWVQVIRGRNFSGTHPAFCRCRSCKPPLVGERDANWLVYGVLAALIGAMLVVM